MTELRRTSSALIVSLRSVSLRPRTGVPEQTRALTEHLNFHQNRESNSSALAYFDYSQFIE
jgi:hypothetical protein